MQQIHGFVHRGIMLSVVQGTNGSFFKSKTSALFVPSYDSPNKRLSPVAGKQNEFWDPRNEILAAAGPALQLPKNPKMAACYVTCSGNVRGESGGQTRFLMHGVFLTEDVILQGSSYNFSISSAKKACISSEERGLASIAFPIFSNSTGTGMNVAKLAQSYIIGIVLHLKEREFPSRLKEIVLFIPECLAKASTEAINGVEKALGKPNQ